MGAGGKSSGSFYSPSNGLRRDGLAQNTDPTIVEAVDPTMDTQRLASFPGIFDDRSPGQILCVGDDVQFAEAIHRFFMLQLLQIVLGASCRVANVPQPVVDDPVPLVLQRRANATAAVVTADDHMLHLQDIHRELQDGEQVEISLHHYVRHISVNEHLTWSEPGDLIGRHATVGAADPEVLRGLLIDQPCEEFWIFSDASRCPSTVIIEQVRERMHWRG